MTEMIHLLNGSDYDMSEIEEVDEKNISYPIISIILKDVKKTELVSLIFRGWPPTKVKDSMS